MGYSLDFYYKNRSASSIAEFPNNLALSVTKIYSDSSLTTTIGTISFNYEIASQSSESNPNIQHSIIATLSLDNGNIIMYSYLRIGSQTVEPNIIYSTEKLSNVKTLKREFLTDDLRKLTLTW